jgi:hypothetical protein
LLVMRNLVPLPRSPRHRELRTPRTDRRPGRRACRSAVHGRTQGEKIRRRVTHAPGAEQSIDPRWGPWEYGQVGTRMPVRNRGTGNDFSAGDARPRSGAAAPGRRRCRSRRSRADSSVSRGFPLGTMPFLIGSPVGRLRASARERQGPCPGQRVMKGECSMSRSLRSDMRIRDRTRRRDDVGTDMTPPAALRYAWLRTPGKVRNQAYLVEG